MFGSFDFSQMGGKGASKDGKKSKKVDNDRFYDLLGIQKDATDKDIKKAYRKKALKEHPDKGGDEEKFKEITRAHQILSDPQKRAAYDRLGEDAFKEGGPGAAAGSGDPFEMFEQKMGPKKTRSIIHPVSCTLEDLYNGKTSRIKVSRQRIKKSDAAQSKDKD